MTTSSAPSLSEAPATVAIVGGHGKIALLLTELLADSGAVVRNIVRNPDHATDIEERGGTPVVLDVEKAGVEDLVEAYGDAEAVVYAAGAGGGSNAFRKYTMDLGGSLLAQQAALELGPHTRFVQISFIGAQNPVAEGTDAIFSAYWDAKRIADDALMTSDLPWTIVKPGALLDDPATGTLTVESGTSRGAKTRRADVAGFIALVLADPRTIGKEFDISEGDTPMAEALEAHLSQG